MRVNFIFRYGIGAVFALASGVLVFASPGAPVPPEFSHPAGFYREPIPLALSTGTEGARIHYTLDGSSPTAASPVYDGPLMLGPKDSASSEIAGIRTTQVINESDVATDWVARLALLGMRWRAPESVFQGTVVRAMSLVPGGSPSPAVTRSYFIDPQMPERYTLPILSLATDKEHFFDHHTGIYVPGAADRNTNPGRPWHNPGNFKNRGRAWERPLHLEFFLPDGQLEFQQDAGVRIHGGASRNFSQKTLRLYARGDYGENYFRYRLFPDSSIDKFKRVLLRNSGNDWPLTLFRDALLQQLVSHLPFDTQNYRPVIVFLNGEYWGIHNLRERYDHRYLEQTYGVDRERIDLLTRNRSVKRGGRGHYDAMIRYMETHGAGEAGHFDHLATQMDVENFLHYQIAQIYFNNTDWPGNNIDYWRFQADSFDPEAAPGHDGRWRWLMYDVDFGFGYGGGAQAYNVDTVRHATNPGSGWSTFILRTLLGNEAFRDRFLGQFANHLNTAFHPERVSALMDRMKEALDPEMDEHIARWGQAVSRAMWEENIQVMRTFAARRPEQVRRHLINHFNLDGEYKLTLLTPDPAAGHIVVNGLPILPGTAGIEERAVSWTGTYFQNVPLRLTAVPTAGYRFRYWNQHFPEPDLHFTPEQDLYAQAEFEVDETVLGSLVPSPHRLADGPFLLAEWSAEAPAGTYPPGMLFLQTAEKDPGAESEPDRPWEGPYNLTSRSRVNGLDEAGFSFINTANAQEENGGYVGAALLALNTLGVDQAFVSWTAGTVTPNIRPYHLRLQYRVGNAGAFQTLDDMDGAPVVYQSHELPGHTRTFALIPLPEEALNRPYVQLRWQYHAIPTRLTGPRAELRIGRIAVTAEPFRIAGEVRDGSFSLEIRGPAGLSYDIFRSEDLREWDLVGTIAAAEPSMVWSDAGGSASHRRFYQVRLAHP